MKQSHNKDNTCIRNNNQPLLIPPSASVDGLCGEGGGGDSEKSQFALEDVIMDSKK